MKQLSRRTERKPSLSDENTLSSRSVLLPLLAMAALLELCFLTIDFFTLGPLGRALFTRSPLTERWPLVLDLARGFFPASWLTRVFDPKRDWLQVALLALLFYGAALVSAVACYLARQKRFASRRYLLFILAAAAVFGLTFLFCPGFPTSDLFSYIMYGRIIVLHHANPLTAIPSQFPQDPVLPYVFWRDTASVYGPVWLTLSAGLTKVAEALGGDLAIYTLLFKSISLVFHLANAVLVWGILGVVAPRRRLMGTMLYAWNPLALLEFADSGHNDSVMLFFLLLGVFLLVRNHEALALVSFALSIDTKYVLVIVLPIYFWWVLREQPGWRLRIRAASWRLAILLLVCAALYVPYWAGPATFGSIIYSPPAQNLQDSLLELVDWPLRRVVAALTHWPTATSDQLASTILKVLASLFFLVLWLRLVPTARSWAGVLKAWWWAIFWYLVIASGYFAPWYVTWLLALAVLYPFAEFAVPTQLLAAGVLVLYPLYTVPSSPLHGSRAILAFGPALLYVLWYHYRHRKQAEPPLPEKSAVPVLAEESSTLPLSPESSS
jgi:hypothetical protein